MANVYTKHFTNNGTVVHIPESFYYQLDKDREGGLSVRYSDKKFKGSTRSLGEAYRPVNSTSWAKLLTKPHDAENIESLVIEKS